MAINQTPETQNTLEVLEKSVLLQLEISCWTGSKALSPEDFESVLGVKIDSEMDEVIKLGNKQLVPRDVINTFLSIRRRAHERALRIGTRFMGGYFIPLEDNKKEVEALLKELQEMKKEFQQKLDQFKDSFHQVVDEWLSNEKVKPFAAVIRKAMPKWEEIESRYDFKIMPITINPIASLEEDLEREVGRLPYQAIKEVSQYAKAAVKEADDRWQGLQREEVYFTQKSVKRIRVMISKLRKLSIMEAGFTALCDELESQIPQVNGKLVGQPAMQLYKLYQIMSDEKILIGALKKGVIEELTSVNVPVDTTDDDSKDDTESKGDATGTIVTPGVFSLGF